MLTGQAGGSAVGPICPWLGTVISNGDKIHASSLFTACRCPTIPASVPTRPGTLTCYLNTHAGALDILVDHICCP